MWLSSMQCLPSTSPLYGNTKKIQDYGYFLFKQFVLPHYRAGTEEVHFLFNDPGRHLFNPKDCEHQRRYDGKCNANEHTHVMLSPQSEIPRPWRQYLNCKQCKRSIVETLGWVYLRTAGQHLKGMEKLILAGCFSGESRDDACVVAADRTVPTKSD